MSPVRLLCHSVQGRVSRVLAEVPVLLVLATDIGQRGAHLVAMRTLTDLRAKVTPALQWVV